MTKIVLLKSGNNMSASDIRNNIRS